MNAFSVLCRTEGIIPALESAHALAGAMRVGTSLAAAGKRDQIILVNLSGRGDKDVQTAAEWFGLLDSAALADGGDR
jgi:tryptophan synthase beta chain